MSSENDEQNSAEGDGYKLGNAVARVVAEHTGLKPYEITELHITGDSVVVSYGVRTDPTVAGIQIRTRRIDPETNDTISDMPGSF